MVGRGEGNEQQVQTVFLGAGEGVRTHQHNSLHRRSVHERVQSLPA